MGEKMRYAPIFLTLGQVRFNPVLQMAESVSALQEHFRKAGYADFAKDELKTIQFNQADLTPQIELLPAVRWRFGNSAKTSEYLLFTDRMIFQTTAYENSVQFIDNVLEGVRVVHEAVQLSYVEGVSVRTLDAIVPQDGKALARYLHPQLLGFYGLSSGELKQSALQALSEYSENCQLIARVVVLHGHLGLSLDLMPLTLTISPRFAQVNCDHAILDNDCAIQRRFDWDLAVVKESLRRAKAGVTEAFDRAVTEEARIEWS